MNSKFVRNALLTAAAVLLAGQAAVAVAAAQTCRYSEVNPGSGKVTARQLSIDLAQSDGTDRPTAWIGPMTIAREGGESCSVDPNVSIIERPIYTDGQHVLVSTYSGSEQIVYAIDAKDCKVMWESERFSGKVRLTGNRLRMDQKTVRLGADCTPQ
ncbi:hypothetical protein [Paraburkholderia sp.]|uniref:hypothetical protein n=1 Tax=Paraburkholderia sp. TaxID=1926495 RepID=UPI003D6E880C